MLIPECSTVMLVPDRLHCSRNGGFLIPSAVDLIGRAYGDYYLMLQIYHAARGPTLTTITSEKTARISSSPVLMKLK
jgi:hypothetical protein